MRDLEYIVIAMSKWGEGESKEIVHRLGHGRKVLYGFVVVSTYPLSWYYVNGAGEAIAITTNSKWVYWQVKLLELNPSLSRNPATVKFI